VRVRAHEWNLILSPWKIFSEWVCFFGGIWWGLVILAGIFWIQKFHKFTIFHTKMRLVHKFKLTIPILVKYYFRLLSTQPTCRWVLCSGSRCKIDKIHMFFYIHWNVERLSEYFFFTWISRQKTWYPPFTCVRLNVYVIKNKYVYIQETAPRKKNYIIMCSLMEGQRN